MIKDETGEARHLADEEPLNVAGARQLASDLLELIEAKALAHRLAFRALAQELAASDPEAALRLQARLDAVRWDPDMVGQDDSPIRDHVAHELSQLIESLDPLVSGS